MIIQSVLDSDLYKYSMQAAVLDNFPGVEVEYRFEDRNHSERFTDQFLKAFNNEVEQMALLRVSDEEIRWFAEMCPFLPPHYLAYLKEYRFNPDEVKATVWRGQLSMSIRGTWERTILWEVPLLALTSELYFKLIDTDWSMEGQHNLARFKGTSLSSNGCWWSDFSTRRRRSFVTQDVVVAEMKDLPRFNGTSNVHLARLHGIKPMGTTAHEWTMGVSALDGLLRANRNALERWNRTYHGNLGHALTDTFGSGVFFADFDGQLARLYDGVRQDSGDPIKFGEAIIEHYKKLRINPQHKMIIFSDSLTVDRALEINKHFQGRIGVAFGIGTFFSNDFENSPPLNIVIKLWSCNGVPVVKLSDCKGKRCGDHDAWRVAMWTFFGRPLNFPGDWDYDPYTVQRPKGAML